MAKQKSKTIFERGVFLNKKGQHSDASVWGRMKMYKTDKDRVFCDGELKVRDCNHSITLNLDWDTGDGYRDQTRANVLFKLNKMIDFLQEYRDAIEKKTK